MAVKPNYFWDEKTGVMICEIEYQGNTFKGMAVCHEDDADFKSELVGSNLAYERAYIKLFKYLKKTEKARLDVLLNVYNSMAQSYRFNPDSFEAKILKKNIHRTEQVVNALNDTIKEMNDSVRPQIDRYEDFFKKVRLKRERATRPN